MAKTQVGNGELTAEQLKAGVDMADAMVAAGKRKARQLPDPTGYKLLIGLPEVRDMTEGGIYKPDSAQQIEELSTVVGCVLKMGPDAYGDADRFPAPYCKKGDWVIFRAFSGTRIEVHGKEFRLINDDTVEAVVEDPQGITRAG